MYKISKRIIDFVLSFILIIFLSTFFVFIAIIIKLSSAGPVFYRAPRAGLNGHPFLIYKFRTMHVGADKGSGTTALNDPRTTKYGAILRNYKIDELPQLINVLLGDMSLVGPRPMTIPQIEEYGPSIAAYKRMRPGITGIWQTNGRNSTTFAERARMDAWYVRNWSLWRDFIILVRTFREVLFARGG